MAENSCVHLHLHSQYSFLDGAIRLGPLFERAREFEMPAVALTDHGNLCGAIDFYQRGLRAGVKPIIGCEFYVTEGKIEDKPLNVSKKAIPGQTDDEARAYIHHLILLAKNKTGYQNLCKLSSEAYLRGLHFKPRINRELLREHSEGLIALSACLKGEIPYHFLMGQDEKARELLKDYQSIFSESFYLEVQENGLREQIEVNRKLLEAGKDFGIPLVATANCHYLDQDDYRSHDVLLCIQSQKTLEDSNALRTESDQFFFKSPQLMREQFRWHPEAVDNTLLIAEQCNLDLKWTDEKGRTVYLLPEYPTPEKEKAKSASEAFFQLEPRAEEAVLATTKRISVEDHLSNIAREGLRIRFEEPWFKQFREASDWDKKKADYLERLEYEIQMINQTGFAGYFLIVADFIIWSKKKQIPVGPGRGSGAGSLVAFSLQITNIDPIYYNLLFERFINPERVSMPDFDVDFCQERRGEVIQYVTEKYGQDKVCQICNYGALSAKAVLKDVSRVFDIPFKEANELTALIPSKPGITLEQAFQQEPELPRLEEEDPQFKKIFTISRELEGLYRQPGIHAAGVIITDKPITHYAPLMQGRDGVPAIQYDKDFSETIGLVKFDFLGLKTLDVIDMACRLVRARVPDFDIDAIDIKDLFVYQMLSEGDTAGVFQIESEGMTNITLKLKPSCIEDVIALVALYRPGPLGSGMVEDFIDRKHGRKPIEYELPELEPILKETYGVILYQEQVMEIAKTLASYTLGEADILRRAMGKKKIEEMAKQRAKFTDGAKKRGIESSKAERIFDLMASFAEYGFNKSHSAAYAYITYQTAFLKKYYPAEFMAGLLTTEMGNTDKVGEYIKDARDHGLEVLPPDINESTRVFNVPHSANEVFNRVRFGFGAIKGVGDAAILSIDEARQSGGPFTGFVDFCNRVALKKVNKKTIEALIKVGCFDDVESHNRATLLASMEKVMDYASRRQAERDLGQESLFGGLSLASGQNLGPDFSQVDEFLESEKLEIEKELVGFYISGHPMDSIREIASQFATATCLEVLNYTPSEEEQKRVTKRRFGERPKLKQVSLVGMLTSVRSLITKKGSKMAFATLEDLTGEVDLVIFPNTYSAVSEKLVNGRAVLVSGGVENRGEGGKLILESVDFVENLTKEKIRAVRLKIPMQGFQRENLPALKEILLKFRGTCRTQLTFLDEDGSRAIMTLPEDYSVEPSLRFAQELKSLVGEDVIEFLPTR